ncbi:hypothetical protein SAY87_000535 [Trapa incisa]|uniref:Uncharacterized protein n=1 Tax=Trapa incisa TaxID=236973 RepID=A0AAN7GIY6_9MYRT|nr:hypothetical protein SAY87_000535 [Trapa incisa]
MSAQWGDCFITGIQQKKIVCKLDCTYGIYSDIQDTCIKRNLGEPICEIGISTIDISVSCFFLSNNSYDVMVPYAGCFAERLMKEYWLLIFLLFWTHPMVIGYY